MIASLLLKLHSVSLLAPSCRRYTLNDLQQPCTDTSETIRGPEAPDNERGYIDYIPLLSVLPDPETSPGKTVEELTEEYHATVGQTQRYLERIRDEFSEVIEGERDGKPVWWRDEPEQQQIDFEGFLDELEEHSPKVAEIYRARLNVVGEDCPTCGVTIESFENHVNGEFVTVQPCDHFIERVDIARPSDYF